MDEPLTALSIRQPWIDMIVRGIKSVEIREWEVRRRGLVALHASWLIDFPTAHLYGYRAPWNLDRGKILAVAEIAEVLSLGSEDWQELLRRHRQVLPESRGCWGVVLRNVRPLAQPVRCRGKPWLFPLSPAVERQVRMAAGLLSPTSTGRSAASRPRDV